MAAIPEDLDGRLREVELLTHANTSGLKSHEDLCAVRYNTINENIADLKDGNRQTNRYLIGIGIAMLAGLAKLVFFP